MVVSFFKKLFNIRDTQEQAKFTGVSSAEKMTAALQLKSAQPSSSSCGNQLNDAEQLSSIDVSALFYTLLFPQQQQQDGIANNLERQVMAQIETALSSPKEIADNVLKLPSKIMELDNKLADEDIDIKDVLKLIEQDPLLSIEILKLCNSPAFRRSDKAVSNLQQALVQLGREQLRRLVTVCLTREMIDVKPIYFRRFGAEIWRHSMQVAFLSGELAEQDSDSAFLLGLLHDVGKIAIFKMLIDAFYQAEPGEQPNSLLFSQLMTTKSLTLSALLAKYWQIPDSFADNLSLLANVNIAPNSGAAKAVWRANVISECSMLLQANKLSEAMLIKLLGQVEISREVFDSLHQKLTEF
ncbi:MULTISPECIES: HDOD domain-containing protein [Pseudomonadati]|uniref:HDOD domain-containing protein n=1 Tax=Shewanella aestuarii TaxID=1028752 RepID=A0ABT0L425_9GAMM|nr:HDOD domain-containing protein [Shewanella aestuarii]MCL1118479.1 HDOD domain-containing protein [Shewanella aestuarii]GGN82722.1 metal-dependent phosphohydrolase [Shewanella aestuarii]